MNQMMFGLLIPLIGTVLGSGMVFFLKKDLGVLTQKALLGFASGVMIAAGGWSLIMPSIEMAEEQGTIPWLPAAVGFLLGIAFLLALDTLIPHLHVNDEKPEGPASNLKKSTMLVLAVTLHNIPEGISGGAVFAGLLMNYSKVTLAGAFALSIGIAIQNVPEGFIVSLPVRSEKGRIKAFLYGMFSGIVEPIGGGITILLASKITPLLPYLLAFAAGAMIYVVVEELIPESAEGTHSNIGTIGFALGFVLMMMLDVAFG